VISQVRTSACPWKLVELKSGKRERGKGKGEREQEMKEGCPSEEAQRPRNDNHIALYVPFCPPFPVPHSPFPLFISKAPTPSSPAGNSTSVITVDRVRPPITAMASGC